MATGPMPAQLHEHQQRQLVLFQVLAIHLISIKQSWAGTTP
jgi:hypothetical protein